MTPAGFPHSDIPGSKPACGSPRLIAAYYVLRRLSAPRHPPCTLSSLTKLEFLLFGESYRFLPDSVVNEPLDRWDPRFRADSLLHPGTAHPIARPCQPMVELIGIEPTTSALQGRRSPN